ncbi:hypothetical protein E2R51_02570 [Jeotgalibacillus sp. S-D1]|uniref:stage III sporulation protein AF n=1 Tax=Jeotgalibacillus sp. S-D1 TaxID=2552189 RepID=UPI00105A4742|nr:stage III sporulation protein AF [Jeotgalibacillus sp. S-D1]TDL34622.1 hypothetical protein E2R51_02570 [Jeotgalibacillus sp. S-D1]
MNEIYQWVINLLVLVVLMALSDLLVPSTSWRPFIRMVLGGLLLVLLLEPLFYFFQKDESIVTIPMEQLEQSIAIEQQQGEAMIDDMNNKHQSYIWNEVSDKLARQAAPSVLEQFNMEISEVNVVPNDSSMEEFRGEVEVVVNGLDDLSDNKEKELTAFLSIEWGVPEESIIITQTGE